MRISFANPSVVALGHWVYNHTSAVKVTRVTALALGATLTGAGFAASSLPLFASGALIIIVTEIAYHSLRFLGCIARNPKHHVFQEGSYGETRVYYKGGVPILESRQTDPYQAGVEHGYLMAPHIFLTRSRICMRLCGAFHRKEIEKALPEIKKQIPEGYMRELEGLVDGMNQWDRKHSVFWTSPATVDEVLLFHLVPDMTHLTLSNLPVVGCSVLIDEHVAGRHLDWPSLGVYGSNTILVDRGGTLSIGIPGLAGDLTNINREGLFLALNVSSPRERVDHVRTYHIPSIFLMRQLSETHKSVASLQEATLPTPLVPFHMSAVDKTDAAAFHFRQGPNNECVVRTPKHQSPLCTFNDNHPDTEQRTHFLFLSEERTRAATDYFETHSTQTPLQRVTGALHEFPINNPLTIQCVIYDAENGTLSFSSDNGFASSAPLHTLSLAEFFSNRDLLYTGQQYHQLKDPNCKRLDSNA